MLKFDQEKASIHSSYSNVTKELDITKKELENAHNIINELSKVSKGSMILSECNTLIAIIGKDPTTISTPLMQPQDLSAATENILLAATMMGYGSCWIGIYPLEDRMQSAGKILNLKDNKFVMKNCFSFQFSCIDKRLDEIVLKCLNKEKNYMFNNQKIILDRYEVHLYKGSDDIKIKMISPIVVKDAYVENDRKKTYYYSPLEKEFALKINTNFKNKYQIFYDKVPESDICFKLISIQEKDKYVTKYNDFYITGWQGIYELSGKREYLEFLYYEL